MNKNILYNIIVLIILINFNRSSIISNSTFEMGLSAFLFALYIVKGRTFDLKFLGILLFWAILNFSSIYFTGGAMKPQRIIKSAIILFSIPYFTLKIMGLSFWFRLERIIYILTLIAIPVFLLNIIFTPLFNSLITVFRPFTRNIFYEINPDRTYWSSFIYINAIDNRNAGFMWEPGAFAMMIVWAIGFNWVTNGLTFNKRIIIYLIALLTTQSTAGYFALFILIYAFYVKKITLRSVFILALSSFIFFFYVYKFEFMGEKVEDYIDRYEKNAMFYQKEFNFNKVNRFQIIAYDLKKISKYPFGYGVFESKEETQRTTIAGVNGLSSLLKMWGIPAFIFLIFLMRRYLNLFNIHKVPKLTISFLLIALLIMFFSNPISQNIFIYFILLTPILFKKPVIIR